MAGILKVQSGLRDLHDDIEDIMDGFEFQLGTKATEKETKNLHMLQSTTTMVILHVALARSVKAMTCMNWRLGLDLGKTKSEFLIMKKNKYNSMFLTNHSLETLAFLEDLNERDYLLCLGRRPLDAHEPEQEWELFRPSQLSPECLGSRARV